MKAETSFDSLLVSNQPRVVIGRAILRRVFHRLSREWHGTANAKAAAFVAVHMAEKLPIETTRYFHGREPR